ncbi:MAG: VWA domain-containing protein [Granulosicoccus sp.]
MTDTHDRRWRLILGEPAGDSHSELSEDDQRMDQALAALYDNDENESNVAGRHGGLGASSPRLSRWLGDIRKYFPTSVVQVMQKDAIDRLELQQLLLEPEILAAAEPDVHLVSTILSLNTMIPEQTRQTARDVVNRLVQKLLHKLDQPTRSAVNGALARNVRNLRPRHQEIDWHRTIRKNLRHYQPDYKTIIPEQLIGFGRKRQSLKDVVLCIDQSGSMAASIIYSSIFGAVLASLPSLRMRFVLFDTAVVDLTDQLNDPVDILFGTQLGGGTDIRKAIDYCAGHIIRPNDTTMVLISDLEEGGNPDNMLKAAARIVDSGTQLIVLLALSDEGEPYYSKTNAARFAALGIPVFACTPDQFPELMAASLSRKDLQLWARGQGVKMTRASHR